MDNLFEQFANISKAHAYDIISQSYHDLKLEHERIIAVCNEQIKAREKAEARVKELEDLISEYTTKMAVNLSGGKVDQFLKDQVPQYSELEQEIEDELNTKDDLKNVL